MFYVMTCVFPHSVDRQFVLSFRVACAVWDTWQGRGDLEQPGLSPTAPDLAPPPESFSSRQAVEPVEAGLILRVVLGPESMWPLCAEP